MKRVLVVGLLLVGLIAPTVGAGPAQAQAEYVEGRDYATEVLHDAWDMNEFSDVSHRLNFNNQFEPSSILVQNGVFSATTRALHQGDFFPLYPGYEDAMNTRKPGTLFPISSSEYQCLYAAMKMPVGSPGTLLGWYRSKAYDSSNYTRSEAFPDGAWALRRASLTAPGGGGQAWTSQPDWWALWLLGSLPSASAQSLEVDWIRLTDCAPVNHDVTWTGANPAALYLRPQGTTREIHVAGGLTSGSYTLDLQGVPPGTYDVIVRMSGQPDQVTQVEITPAPIADFIRPSMLSGEDYASAAGNPWDFSDTTDIEDIGATPVFCVTWSVSGGVLHLETAPPEDQPSECKPGNVADPRVYLNMPTPITTLSNYRYLSFRMHTGNADWPVQTVPNGMMVRWIWAQDMPPYDPCYQVTEDIPYDIGWWTTSVDMHDPFNRQAEESRKGTASDPITCDPMRWDVAQPQIIRMRFDPNENFTGTGQNESWVPAFHFIQQLDWIRLTKVDRTTQGAAFPVRLSLNMPAGGLDSMAFYYTTDRNAPTQHVALQASPVVPSGPNLIYLPLVLRHAFSNDWYQEPVPNGYTFLWDTAGVAPGEYFMCVEITEASRTNLSCSQAPVAVAAS